MLPSITLTSAPDRESRESNFSCRQRLFNSTDYLKDVANGYNGNLADWLIWVSAKASRSENDQVLVHDNLEVKLSDLLEQRNQHVIFQADLLDIVFVEK